MPRILTLQQLRDAGACEEQVRKFQRRFGKKVLVTVKVCRSVAQVFHFHWAARRLLSPAAWAKYRNMDNAAWADYERIREAAWAHWIEDVDEYVRIRDTAWADYERARAITFAKLYNTQKVKRVSRTGEK